MKTCVSMNCPFIDYCKDYNFLVDRGEKCETKERLIRSAKIATVQDNPEYCLQTNCLGCDLNRGNYKECPFFEQKKILKSKKNDERFSKQNRKSKKHKEDR